MADYASNSDALECDETQSDACEMVMQLSAAELQ
jgi:hypothetical protein